MKNKKIAVIGTRGLPSSYGGVEKHCEDLYSQLVEKGYEVTVYARQYYTGKKEFKYFYKGIKVINIPVPDIKGFETFLHTFISSLLAVFSKADILHFHCQGPALFSFIPALFAPKKIIILTCHNISWHSDKWGWIGKNIIKLGELASTIFPHKIIVVSENIQQYYKEKYNLDTLVLPNGVQVPDTVPLDDFEKSLGISEKKYLLTVTRLVPEKKIETLIEAANTLDDDFKLVVVGGSAGSDDYVSFLKEKSKNNDKIVFTGYMYGEDLQKLFSNAFAYVSASKLEGLPITVLEAMASYLPVIMSNIPAHEEIARQNPESSLIFELDNVEDCRKQIKKLMNLDKSHMKLIQEASRNFIVSNYTWEKIVEDTHLVYQEEFKA